MAGKVRWPGSDELAAQVADLREQVRTLKAENARLRAELAALRGEGEVSGAQSAAEAEPAQGPPTRKTPPRWAKANVVRVVSRRPRRARVPVPGRRREAPDRRLIHALSQCPHCQAPLQRGRVVGRRQVLTLPAVRVEVVEHVVLDRRCRGCGAVCRGVMPDLSAEVGPGRRIGWDVAALAAVLRTKLRLPIAQLQWLLRQVWGLHLAAGEVSALLAEAARAGQATYDGLLAEARASPVAHVDETGWRQDGRHGFVWTVTTPTVRFFQFSPSRAGAVVRRLLGAEYEGVVVSDFYTAYDQLDGLHQRCWAHLLRDIHDLRQQHPDHAGLHAWATAVQALYERAVAWTATATETRPAAREQARLGFERELLAVCRAQPAKSPQTALCRRAERYHPELFTFVADPMVPPTNNAAERALRPLVIARKISGGTRSPQGSQTRMVLQSLVATCDLRGCDPVAELLALLRAPRVPDPKLGPL
jgi:transposase